MSKKFYIYNNNTCTRVKLYGIDVSNLFKINNYKEVDNVKEANLIIINTCSFLKSKEDYFLSFIKNVNNNLETNQKIMIIGCLPSINKEGILEINKDILLFGRDLQKIKEHFNFEKNITTKATTVSDKLEFKKNYYIYLTNAFYIVSI